MAFKKITPEEIPGNVFSTIGKEWMLICAGTKAKYNMMTASWGGMGILWGKPVCYIVIRPTRYTYQFTETNPAFSINILPEKLRKVLNFCGEKSGRDVNKMKESGLTPLEDQKTVYFQESRLALLCKKIYYQDLNPANFLDSGIEKNYAKKDYHRMYVGEILSVLIQPDVK